MSAASFIPPKKTRDTSFPAPKRGQIKAQIFESFKKTLVSAISAQAGNRGDGTNSAGGTPSAAHITPMQTQKLPENVRKK